MIHKPVKLLKTSVGPQRGYTSIMNNTTKANDDKVWAAKWFAARAAKVLGITVAQLAEAAAEGSIVAKKGSVVAMYLKIVAGK